MQCVLRTKVIFIEVCEVIQAVSIHYNKKTLSCKCVLICWEFSLLLKAHTGANAGSVQSVLWLFATG